jgi:hypothetical protein
LVFNITDFLAYQEAAEATLEPNEALIAEAERRSSVLSKERVNYQCKSSRSYTNKDG